ncbi:hypothetical protein K8S17_03295 [bacterium]|nr:hypothetical protein [bacterium]
MRFLAAATALVALGAATVWASSLDLIENGDFELPQTTGWSQSIAGSYLYITRATSYDPDADYEVKLFSNNGHGNARLWQNIVIPSTDTYIGGRLKGLAYDGAGAWCASGLIITYLDVNGASLGKTAFAARSSICPWTESDVFHIIDLTTDWADYGFTLSDELLNLPGIEADEVRELEVMLLTTASNC